MAIPGNDSEVLDTIQPGSVASNAVASHCSLCKCIEKRGFFTMPNGITVSKHQRIIGDNMLEQIMYYEEGVSPTMGEPYTSVWYLVSPYLRLPITSEQYYKGLADHNAILRGKLVG